MNELQSRFFNLAEELAVQLNGEIAYVPDEAIELILDGLTANNMQESAEELAQLSAWYN